MSFSLFTFQNPFPPEPQKRGLQRVQKVTMELSSEMVGSSNVWCWTRLSFFSLARPTPPPTHTHPWSFSRNCTFTPLCVLAVLSGWREELSVNNGGGWTDAASMKMCGQFGDGEGTKWSGVHTAVNYRAPPKRQSWAQERQGSTAVSATQHCHRNISVRMMLCCCHRVKRTLLNLYTVDSPSLLHLEKSRVFTPLPENTASH